MRVIANAALERMIERADNATREGVSGPFTMDHGNLIGFNSRVAGKSGPQKELFVPGGLYVAGRAALQCASSADPETLRELVRGYRLAKQAGLLSKKTTR